jgi:CubicO group peptidase (beta-lactamase class C family)
MGELHPAVGRADSLLSSAIENGVPGAVVLVGRSGEVAHERAMGSADLAHHVPMHLDTTIRVGSITKQFTAAAIMKLEEAGALRVTDRLSRFLPGHARGDEIVLHRLLTHTSGVPNHTRKPGSWPGPLG